MLTINDTLLKSPRPIAHRKPFTQTRAQIYEIIKIFLAVFTLSGQKLALIQNCLLYDPWCCWGHCYWRINVRGAHISVIARATMREPVGIEAVVVCIISLKWVCPQPHQVTEYSEWTHCMLLFNEPGTGISHMMDGEALKTAICVVFAESFQVSDEICTGWGRRKSWAYGFPRDFGSQ